MQSSIIGIIGEYLRIIGTCNVIEGSLCYITINNVYTCTIMNSMLRIMLGIISEN